VSNINDWVPIYAEARAAFPLGVRLRTEGEGRGGVRIIAYRREFHPPIPPGMTVSDDAPGGVILSYRPNDDDGDLVTHVERTRRLSYVIYDRRVHRAVTADAARRWHRDAARRGQA
jgi:hypothetical protein